MLWGTCYREKKSGGVATNAFLALEGLPSFIPKVGGNAANFGSARPVDLHLALDGASYRALKRAGGGSLP